MVITEKLHFQTSDNVPDLINITEKVKHIVNKSGITDGQVLIYSQHTTAAIIIQEEEPGLYSDLCHHLNKLAPRDDDYHHNDNCRSIPNEPLNAHSHCQHLLLGCSEVVPIQQQKMLLGTYQHIYLVELDHSRPRTVIVQVLGE